MSGNTNTTSGDVIGPINYSPTTIVVISLVGGAFVMMFIVVLVWWIAKKKREHAYQRDREEAATIALSQRSTMQTAMARSVNTASRPASANGNAGHSLEAAASQGGDRSGRNSNASSLPYLGTIVLPPGVSVTTEASSSAPSGNESAANAVVMNRVDENEVVLNINDYDPSSAAILTPAIRASMDHRSRGSSAAPPSSSSKPSPSISPARPPSATDATAASKNGWEEHVTSKGKHYWWNSRTGQTSWADPKHGIIVEKQPEDEPFSTLSSETPDAPSAPL